jgi:hypothetical protein
LAGEKLKVKYTKVLTAQRENLFQGRLRIRHSRILRQMEILCISDLKFQKNVNSQRKRLKKKCKTYERFVFNWWGAALYLLKEQRH